MAGARDPSNGPPLDTATSAMAVRFPAERYPGPVEFMSSAQNPPTYSEIVASAQTLYSQVWDELRRFADAYSVSRPQKQQQQQLATSLRDFSSRNPNNLDHQSYEVPKNVDTTVDISNLMGTEDDPTNLDNESGTLAPTIQFDLGNNLYSSAAGPYGYSNDASMAAQVNSGQACFANDSSLTSTVSTVWSPGHGFSSSKRGKLSSNNLDNVSTVDYTTRWDVQVDNNLQNRSLTNHSSASTGNKNMQAATTAGAESAETFERKLQQQQQSMVVEPSVQQRIERALTQRFYLVNKEVVRDSKFLHMHACDFQVVGSSPGTGGNNVVNMYTVRYSNFPRCTCSDAELPCAHILFIMVRVLKQSPEDHEFWQRPLPFAYVGAYLSEFLRRSSGGGPSGGGDESAELQTFLRVESGYCPICFEMMTDQDGNGNNAAAEELSYCKFCSNGVHADCFQKWSYSKQESGERVSTCIFCHSVWIDDTHQQQQQQLKKRKAESDMDPDSGYVNLSDYSTSHRGEEFGFDRLYTHDSRPKLDREWRS